MNPITNLETLNSISNISNVYQFGNTAEALDALNTGKFNVINNPNSITGNGKVINFNEFVQQPEGLTGGSRVGSTAMNVTENAGGVGVATAGATVAVSLPQVIGGICAGFGLGLVSYELAPEFWTDISNAIFGTEIAYDNIEDYSLIGLFKDDVLYFGYDLLATVKNALIRNNAFSETYSIEGITSSGSYTFTTLPLIGTIQEAIKYVIEYGGGSNGYTTFAFNNSSLMASIASQKFAEVGAPVNTYDVLCQRVSNSEYSISITAYVIDSFTGIVTNPSYPTSEFTIDSNYKHWYNLRFYVTVNSDGNYYLVIPDAASVSSGEVNRVKLKVAPYYVQGYDYSVTNLVLSYDIQPEVPGIQIQENATLPDEFTPIPEEFPDWASRAIEIGGIDPDTKEIVTIPYYPVTLPSADPLTNPVAIPQADAQVGTIPDTWKNEGIADVVAPVTENAPIDPTSTDDGETPIPYIPAISGQGISSALFTVYNPTQSQLNSLAGVLWTDDIISTIKAIFQNPMDGVISLMSLFATPTCNTSGNIILGTVDSGVSSKIVTQQYVTIDCGSVTVPEKYGNVTDYSPYTNVSIFLPFIGIKKLNANEIIAGKVNVKYRVDVLTGTCIAIISVIKNNIDAVLYTFEGNCGIELPMTGADRSRLMSGILSTAGGIVGGIAGTVSMPVAGMAIAGGLISASHVGVERSGAFSGNGGAMGNKKPYLIITRTVPYTADKYNELYGFPSNVRTTLSSLSGFTRVKDVKTSDIPNATEEEKTMIENELKEGVYV